MQKLEKAKDELRALDDKTCKIGPERFGLKRFVN